MIDKLMALIILLFSVFLNTSRSSPFPLYCLLTDVVFFVALVVVGDLDARGIVCFPVVFIEAVVKLLLFEKLQRLLGIDTSSICSASTWQPACLSKGS